MHAKRVWGRRTAALLSRGLIGACLALLLALQGLAAAQGASAHADTAAAAPGSAITQTCFPHDAGSNTAPTERRHPFSCCFFCGQADVDLFSGRALWRAFLSLAPGGAGAPGRATARPGPDRRLFGWATSWSSQAPPLFS